MNNPSRCRAVGVFLLLGLALPVAVAANLLWGSVHIPAAAVGHILTTPASADAPGTEAWRFIIVASRLPAALTALLAGAALAVGGLLMQSYFRNPLAGPSILGVTAGAGLGVAMMVLAGAGAGLGLPVGAFVGATAVLALLTAMGRVVRHAATLLIVGLLVGYLANAVITLLTHRATADGVRTLALWGMGDFTSVGWAGLPALAAWTVGGLLPTLFLMKPLNAWMLGESYARNLGISPTRTRLVTLLSAGLLAAAVTAYCGPVAFVGLAVPHVARLLLRTDDHRLLLPATALIGALVASLCLTLCALPGGGQLLPLNAVTPLVGLPVILYVLWTSRTRY